MKLAHCHDSDGHEEYLFHCPGCDMGHRFIVKWGTKQAEYYRDREKRTGEKWNSPTWTFNGDLNNPTFAPSLLMRWDEGEPPVKKVCHLFLKSGVLEFLSDCTHDYAGKSVPLESLP